MYRLPLILVLSAITAGCASTSTVSPSLDNSIIISKSSSDRARFHNIQHRTNAKGRSIIHGELKRIGTWPVRGHIDYKLVDRNQQVVKTGKIAYSNQIKKKLPSRPRSRQRMKKRPSYFSFPLKHNWQPDQYRLYLNWDNVSHSAQK